MSDVTSPPSVTGGRVVLLTGVTGFLGKVTLYELLRRRRELGVTGIVAVVRGRGNRSARDRFHADVATSPAFAAFTDDWTRIVSVLDGDLAKPGFGKAPGDAALLARVTHVVHAAAAVSFTLPGPVAARANVRTTLNLLDALADAPALQRIVYVSTAYVTPHRDGTIPEALVPLPDRADALLATIERGDRSDADVLARTGHPNTYTLTKTIAEHMIAGLRGRVPLTIVRPSIITSSRHHPHPGWIDSATGFGAFATMIGLGHLRAIVGDGDARLDLIPVDDVAESVITAMTDDTPGLTVRHAVAGKDRAPTVHECWDEIEAHFRRNPVQRLPARRYLGPRDSSFLLADLVHHRVPIALANLGSRVRRRQAKKLASRLAYLNDVFPYFTTRTFDFALSSPPGGSAEPFDGRAMVRDICRGVSRHLLGQREDEWVLAGRAAAPRKSNLRWVLKQPFGNGFVRLGIFLSSKTLRKTVDTVTVDIPSFERARDAIPAGASVAILPTHRSFLDFILCSYLAFARPDLGLRIPYVAAATEFGRLPLLGRLLRAVHAFYVERGASKENRHLAERVHRMLDAGETIEFFVEGARSRSRAFLPPKRGLLRCLETSGRTVALLPVAISYDRLPEESVFAKELAGAPKSALRVGPLFGWLADVVRGRVQLGRVHMACGAPVFLDGTRTAQRAGEEVMQELRGAMAVTSFHIDAYHAHAGDATSDPAAIRRAIEAAGGRVLASRLPVPGTLDPFIARTLREHFAGYLDAANVARADAPVTVADRRATAPTRSSASDELAHEGDHPGLAVSEIR